jgi:hypothetical protein
VDRVVLTVQNKFWADVTVFLDVNSRRTRIGEVTAVSTSSFNLPVRLLLGGQTFRLVADPIGSLNAISSETVSARPGQVVEWVLENDLRRSSVTVF